jgi:hypothetical protein
MTRLDRQDVERQISEMYAALADCPRDETYDAGHRQAQAAERKLRGQLDEQDRLDASAPDLLNELGAIADALAAGETVYIEPGSVQSERVRKTVTVAKAEGK